MKNKVNLIIWGREFELSIIYQNYPGEEVTMNQEKTVRSIDILDFGVSLKPLVEYIRENNFEDIGDTDITNIFKYVMPKCILIPREDEKRIIALMCNYRFDIEHGLTVVYENEKYKTVGPQDIIL